MRTSFNAFPSLRFLLATLALVACGDDPVKVVASPVIQVSTAAVSFSAPANTAALPAQMVSIGNGGGVSIDGLTVTTSFPSGQRSDWLSATLSATQTPSVLTLVPRVLSTLSPGTYQATVTIASNDAETESKTVAVTLTVTNRPTILPKPSGVFWNLTPGSQAGAQLITVENFGDGLITGLAATVVYPAGQPAGWLNASLDRTTTPATLTVHPQTASLPRGSYSASIELKSPDAVLPYSVAVGVSIDIAPRLVIVNGNLTFVRVAGQQGPGSTQAFGIRNAGSGTLAGLKCDVSYESGQATPWLNTYPTLGDQGGTVVVQAGGGLAAGTYKGFITCSAPGALDSPAVVTVTYVQQ